jgi:iron-sulfur cluster assembly accessory protein
MELTNDAIAKLIEKTKDGNDTIRIGLTGGGCAGFEYIFDYESRVNSDDHMFDYGKFTIVIDALSLPYFKDATLDYIREGINEQFKIINPAEKSSCGCGISVQF